MVNWRAVVVGFLVELVLGTVGFVVPVLGQLTAAVIGGFVAGYLVRGSLTNGAWHGLLAGALGGVALAIVVGVGGSLLFGAATGAGASVVFGLGVTTFAVLVVFLLSLPSALGGAIGAALA